MPVIEFAPKDLLMGTVVTPGWYRVLVQSVGEAPAATVAGKTPSVNYPVEGVILFDGDNGSQEFKDVPLSGWQFNSKAIGFAVGFLEAFGVKVEAGKRFDLASAAGKELDVFVENDTYNGRMVNRINHKYRPANPAVTAA